ncbi:SRPBCC family protein [Sphingomonas sp. BGYR3]|uniref:SRPBCC family protein n=1 Tax=Sphingomonas sp. BGYR3 TaxID=2975483 RepID=UPI0021A958BE|nr:SRPBCC family protein [Sphingomonas sp. BGYR3]MDG5487473.1 SRPBCC family protein [Sphingomonas sp. BGYR3]
MTLESPRPPTATRRIAGAFAVALVFALGVYLLLDFTRPGALVGFSFLLVLPAAVTAFIAYVGDPHGEKARGWYLGTVPFVLMLLVIVASMVFLREGAICILMLAPLWIVSSLIGGALTMKLRQRRKPGESIDATFNASVLLVIPLVAFQVEPMIPLPRDRYVVTRSIDIAADPMTVWNLAKGVGAIRADEGRFTISQSLIGLPRPTGVRLDAERLGAVRHVAWQDDIRFDEVVTAWQPGRRLHWDFRFGRAAMDGWAMQDRHLMPDSPHYRITDGGYRLTRLPDGGTRLTLTTRYWAQTPVNPYARAWGELLIGDVSNNVLAIIAQRAEAASTRPAPHAISAWPAK